VSKERARRRAEREATRAVAQAKRGRLERRRARRRALVRKLTPRRRRRRAWLLGRRSPGQRAAIVGVAIGLLWMVWYFVEPWPLRIAFTILVVLVLPLIVVVTFDRRV
jgi:Flp pilus assembly protein TadB